MDRRITGFATDDGRPLGGAARVRPPPAHAPPAAIRAPRLGHDARGPCLSHRSRAAVPALRRRARDAHRVNPVARGAAVVALLVLVGYYGALFFGQRRLLYPRPRGPLAASAAAAQSNIPAQLKPDIPARFRLSRTLDTLRQRHDSQIAHQLDQPRGHQPPLGRGPGASREPGTCRISRSPASRGPARPAAPVPPQNRRRPTASPVHVPCRRSSSSIFSLATAASCTSIVIDRSRCRRRISSNDLAQLRRAQLLRVRIQIERKRIAQPSGRLHARLAAASR